MKDKVKDIKLYVIDYDHTGYLMISLNLNEIYGSMIIFDRCPEWDGPNLTHRKAWFDDEGEIYSKANVYLGQTDDEYKEMYEGGFFDNIPKWNDHKTEIFERYKQQIQDAQV